MRVMITHARDAKAHQIRQDMQPSFAFLVDEIDLPSMHTAQLKMQGNAYQAASIIHQLLQLCLDENIDILIPLQPWEQQYVQQSELLFQEYGIQILYK